MSFFQKKRPAEPIQAPLVPYADGARPVDPSELRSTPTDPAGEPEVMSAAAGSIGRASESNDALEKLKFAHTLREYHHKALGEEEKHYTWLNSLVLSGQLVAFAADKLSLNERSALILILSGLGIASSLLALRVVRAESDNFQLTLRRFVRYYNPVFTHPQDRLEEPLEETNRSMWRVFWRAIRRRQSIRESFQLIFVVFIALFVAVEVAFVSLHHLRWWP